MTSTTLSTPTYGAVGNGTNNDTTAIQAAITAAAVKGGIVDFPPGIYLVTSTLTIAQNCGPAEMYL